MITELDLLMALLVRTGFKLETIREGRHGQTVSAAVREHAGIADVLIMQDETAAIAYRTPAGNGLDVFNPTHVMWSYANDPLWTLRTLLTLSLPSRQDPPTVLVEARHVGLGEGARCWTTTSTPRPTKVGRP